MITREQITALSKKLKTNETTVFREYLQILFLSRFYQLASTKEIFFKGGTCLHLLYQAPRFSEDLDFTCQLSEAVFSSFMAGFFAKFSQEEDVEFKKRKSLAGKRFLLAASPLVLGYRVFVNLDFSFREKALRPQKSILETEYPVIFTAYIHHLSREEILAEKIRAIMTRKKGRDLYDLWYLLNQGTKIENELVKKKLAYYDLEKIKKAEILKRVGEFSEKDFILDLRPFVPLDEREKLAGFFRYLKDYLAKKLTK